MTKKERIENLLNKWSWNEEDKSYSSLTGKILHEFNQTSYSYRVRSYNETQEWFETNVK
jgi:hypothetical protein